MINGFVYCWTNIENLKIYVGVHKGTPTDGYVCSSKLMLEEYNKNPNIFTRQIIAEGPYELMRNLESKILQSANVAGDNRYYNMHNSDGKFYLKQHTEETKKKISVGHKGKKRPDLAERNRLGMSEDTKKKLSDQAKLRLKNTPNPMTGKSHTDNTKKKISLANKGKIRKPISEETRRKMSEAKRLYWNKLNGD